MTTTPFQKHLATAAVLVIAMILAFAEQARAARIGVRIEGTKQGKFKGSDKSGSIPAMGYTFEIKSPRDLATGQASGKVQNSPLTITKLVDGASPQLFQALTTNELLKNVTIELLATNANGEESVAQTIKLNNAVISNIRQYLDAGGDGKSAMTAAGLQEDVSIAFQSLEFPGAGGATPAPTAAPEPTAAAPAAVPAAAPAVTDAPAATRQPATLQPAQPVQPLPTTPAAKRRRPVAQPAPAPQPPPP